MAARAESKSTELPGSGSYPELTSMRALAALAVLATHAAYWTGHYRGDGALLWARMDFGVALFFTLSGFLLFRGWLVAAAQQRTAPSNRTYFRKRAVRILRHIGSPSSSRSPSSDLIPERAGRPSSEPSPSRRFTAETSNIVA